MITLGAMSRIGLLAGALIGITVAARAEDGTFVLWPKWGPFIDLEGKVGTKRDLGSANLFVPFWQDDRSMVFGDFRIKGDDQNSWEGNFGSGYRRMLDGGWNAGVYGFYDHRRSSTANFFDQLTFGAELLGTNFDARVNSYWPIGNVQQTAGAPIILPSTATVVGSTLQVSTPGMLQSMEYALRGFDAEAGVRIPITPAQSPFNMRFYAGGFRFDEPTGVAPVIAGPRLRLEFTDYNVPGLWNGTRFTVGAEWQTDSVRGSQFFAGLRLRIPLQAEPRRADFTLQERRMTDTIVRDVDIVSNVQTVQITPAITESATGTAAGGNLVAISSSSTLATDVANAGANSTVVLSGTFSTATSVTLQSGQTMMGTGALSVRTASGRVVTANVTGGATINGTPGAGTATIAMGHNSTLTGMTISDTDGGGLGANSLAVRADGVSGATISNNVISAFGSTGSAQAVLVINGSSNISVVNNALTANGNGTSINAYALQVNGSSATVSGNTLNAGGSTSSPNDNAVRLNGANIGAGSTGNIMGSGTCKVAVAGSGSTVGFTNGTTCGP